MKYSLLFFVRWVYLAEQVYYRHDCSHFYNTSDLLCNPDPNCTHFCRYQHDGFQLLGNNLA